MTIKIYEADGGSSYIEFGNNGESEPDVMGLVISHDDYSKELYFDLSKDDAKEIVAYLKKEFRFG